MSDNNVQDHYAGGDIGSSMASRILAAVYAVYGRDAAITPETLAPLDHFNSRGLAATQELAKLLDPQADESLLDIGSGIGGPARWIAMQYGCTVTGVDVTAAFCEAARPIPAACRPERAAGVSGALGGDSGGEFSRDRCGHPPRPDGGGLCHGVVS